MANVKQGTLTKASEWWKHLRKFGKRVVAKRERVAHKKDIKKRTKELA